MAMLANKYKVSARNLFASWQTTWVAMRGAGARNYKKLPNAAVHLGGEISPF